MFGSRDNICHIVKSPANVKWKTRELATEVAFNAVKSLEGAGVFAVELFLTKDGEVVSFFINFGHASMFFLHFYVDFFLLLIFFCYKDLYLFVNPMLVIMSMFFHRFY